MFLSRAFLLSLVFCFIGAAFGHADQFVLFDVTFTHEDALNSKPSQSHYYVKSDRLNPERPKDWTAPVDYRNGTVRMTLIQVSKGATYDPKLVPDLSKAEGK